MKHTTLFCAAIMLASHCFSQTAVDLKRSSSNPCLLSAKMVKQNNKTDVNFKTDYGSSDIDKTRQINYECSIRWLGKTNVPVTVEYIFMLSDGGKATPEPPRTEDVELVPSKTQTLILDSPSVVQNNTKLVAIGVYSKDGQNVKGLVIRLKREGEIIKVWSSDGSWLKHAWKTDFDLSDTKKKE
jgi:hypothetical protein